MRVWFSSTNLSSALAEIVTQGVQGANRIQLANSAINWRVLPFVGGLCYSLANSAVRKDAEDQGWIVRSLNLVGYLAFGFKSLSQCYSLIGLLRKEIQPVTLRRHALGFLEVSYEVASISHSYF